MLLREVKVALMAITPFDTTALAKDIEPICYNKIINFYGVFFSVNLNNTPN